MFQNIHASANAESETEKAGNNFQSKQIPVFL